MKHWKTLTAIASATLLALGAGVAGAEETGKAEYMNACASCHGAMGLGDGPMAEFMSTKVPDLTQLSAANDGEFPMLKVIHIMDGRTGLRGHGSEMPIWGDIFKSLAEETGDYGAEIFTRGRILSVGYYLESLQK